MRFSIRSLLAIMLLCGIAFPLIVGLGNVRREEAMRAQLQNEIQLLREQLALDDPKHQLVRKHRTDEFESLKQLREIAQQHFATLQKKYGKVDPRGPGVVSLRTIPQLMLQNGVTPTAFRLQVPGDREVWLKYAVVQNKANNFVSAELDQIEQPLTETGFQHNGLYEVRLQPGERIMKISLGPAHDHDLPITIGLDGDVLLNTQFGCDGTPSSGTGHISGRHQIDFERARDLPWLLDVHLKIRDDEGSSQDAPHSVCLWLSDRSSDFDRFPKLDHGQ